MKTLLKVREKNKKSDALASKIQIVLREGTGAGGANSSSNSASITFNFAPAIVKVLGYGYTYSDSSQFMFYNDEYQGCVTSYLTTSYVKMRAMSGYVYSDYSSYVKKSSDGKTIYWYNSYSQSNTDYPERVLNKLGKWYFLGMA